jgi:hypothetical protein
MLVVSENYFTCQCVSKHILAAYTQDASQWSLKMCWLETNCGLMLPNSRSRSRSWDLRTLSVSWLQPAALLRGHLTGEFYLTFNIPNISVVNAQCPYLLAARVFRSCLQCILLLLLVCTCVLFSLPEVAKLCKTHNIPHLVNNAYGIQIGKCTHLLTQVPVALSSVLSSIELRAITCNVTVDELTTPRNICRHTARVALTHLFSQRTKTSWYLWAVLSSQDLMRPSLKRLDRCTQVSGWPWPLVRTVTVQWMIGIRRAKVFDLTLV